MYLQLLEAIFIVRGLKCDATDLILRNQIAGSVFKRREVCMLGRFQKVSLLTVVGLLLLGSITASAANNCEQRIRKAEMQVERAVARHGSNSRQAENKRRHLEEVRATCHWR